MAEVLKLVNSPFYGLRREIKTISHAVSLLGTNTVRTLALSFSLVQGLRRNGWGKLEFPHFWRRSLVSGVAARELGRSSNLLQQQEELFLAGLMQDIGMLGLQEALPESYADLVHRAKRDHHRLVKLERRELRADHAEVGSWLAGQWRLPEVYRACWGGQPQSQRGYPVPDTEEDGGGCGLLGIGG